ncbi:MAG: hypothetical protein GWO20_01835 [Candidatus Korarchaeota archaeon]|nr:hypothetical protein [Candidatus Korarchaeota archaeon]NIU82259.1 hypothetical protein [Candidatus Thorarchaeota archaeon]NIW12713.1 hypothetical protein [Candidatus Thorarchaeota archaeon]NIW50924.1 hypothetical protein [Candidatus Korarchaeota archaeon]
MKEDTTKEEKMFVLKLDAFLHRQFEVTIDQELLNASSYRLYEELQMLPPCLVDSIMKFFVLLIGV